MDSVNFGHKFENVVSGPMGVYLTFILMWRQVLTWFRSETTNFSRLKLEDALAALC